MIFAFFPLVHVSNLLDPTQARSVCIELLESYRARAFVMCVLDTLTQLAEKSLIDIPLQVRGNIRFLAVLAFCWLPFLVSGVYLGWKTCQKCLC